MRIDFTNKFNKQLKKSPDKIKKAFQERLAMFIENKYNQTLNNHQLKGEHKKYRSINVTGDWRAWFIEDGNILFFDVLGTHSQLYKK